jgi:hypothetical protein
MKTFATVLVVLAVFALVPGAPCTAETSPATAPSVSSAEDFLATLSAGEALQPLPTFLSTVCTDSSQCPAGQLCCYPCGIDGCDFVCMTVVRNRCPFFP